MRISKIMRVICLTILFGILCAGCASETGKKNEKIVIYGVKDPQISLIQILAQELGYFEEEGLEIENIYLSTVQDLAPIVINGQSQLTFATNYSAAIWKLNGADIDVVMPTANIGGTQCLLLDARIPLNSSKDLEGKKIGLLVGSTQQLLFRRMCDEMQLDRESFEIVPLPFAEQLTALSSGQVDMIATTEPWVTKTGKIMDVTLLCNGLESFLPDHEGVTNWCRTYSCLLSQETWLKENPESMKKIIRSLNRAVDYVNENYDSAVTILAKQFEVPREEMMQMMEHNVYVSKADDSYMSSIQELIDYILNENIVSNAGQLKMDDFHDFTILNSIYEYEGGNSYE